MSNKRILLVTQYFHPENFKSNDIAFELQKRGYQVDALVGIPNYPEGKYYKGYGIFRKRIQTINGVKVYRAFQTPRGVSANSIGLSFNYVTYAIFASIWALFFSIFKKKYHAIIVHQTSPITQALPAIVIGKIRKVPIYLWVLDLWPDAIVSSTHIENKTVLNIINRLTNMIYNNSFSILVSSILFGKELENRNVKSRKIVYFPNWSDDFTLNIKSFDIKLPNGFVVTMAGNIGVSQDIESIVGLAVELKKTNVKIVLVGNGSYVQILKTYIIKYDLSNTVFYLGKFDYELMPYIYAKSDAMLLTLNSDFEDSKKVVPARLQSYMSAGRPVLAMIEGGAADIIQESKCGYVVNSGNYKELSDIIRNKILMNTEEFKKLGSNGRRYYEEHYKKDDCITNLEKELYKELKNSCN